ncbi:hypothetical protein P691DRAFT_770189 [Macrolepiota fuliginosa MF-IS2]|uniref:RNase III domain-containing protein n=1 Tax=Macrolepiota fuliginosa MF-IS2 TaxID=1400762 RepID=A0A9P6CBI7_9AGAR|nr:hypothetical protein P691DRAFT_770189 [Macrolepiota fuliginosa MF-IS2]
MWTVFPSPFGHNTLSTVVFNKLVAMFSHPSFTFSLPPVSQRGQSATSDDVAEADRLEFVGDVLISGPVAVMLYELHRKGTPNDYSKLKAVLTCNAFFANLMVRVGFVCRDGSPRIKEFADALEASVGLYLKDRGSQAVEDWVWDNFCPLVEVALSIYQEHT